MTHTDTACQNRKWVTRLCIELVCRSISTLSIAGMNVHNYLHIALYKSGFHMSPEKCLPGLVPHSGSEIFLQDWSRSCRGLPFPTVRSGHPHQTKYRFQWSVWKSSVNLSHVSSNFDKLINFN